MRLSILFPSILIGFSACVPLTETTKPKPRPHSVKPVQTTASVESQQVAAYYAKVQERLRAKGRLRQELEPSDALFSAVDLVKNFERVALFDEYSVRNGQFVERQTASSLRRWERPVRIGLNFGPSVSEDQRKLDTAYVRSFSARLARISGLDIQVTDAKRANFSILFLNLDEQKSYTPNLLGRVNYLVPQILEEIKTSPRGIFCVAYAVSDVNSLSGLSLIHI